MKPIIKLVPKSDEKTQQKKKMIFREKVLGNTQKTRTPYSTRNSIA